MAERTNIDYLKAMIGVVNLFDDPDQSNEVEVDLCDIESK